MNEQTKIRISYALRNRKKSATHAHLIAESLKGKSKTEKHKKAISAAMKKLWEQRRKDTNYQGDKTCFKTRKIIK